MIRPGCNKFLKELSQYYEIVVFTAAMPDYADWIRRLSVNVHYNEHDVWQMVR